MRKITASLTGEAEQYFAEVQYSLEGKKGSATQSEVIQHCLTELSLFEKFAGDQLTNWLSENYPKQYDKFLQDNKLGKYTLVKSLIK